MKDGVAAVIQARMGSTRLPGKTLADLGGFPVLDWVTYRVGLAERVDEVIVATSTQTEDDQLADHLEGSDINVVRGDPDDVLGRFGVALATTDAGWIVRVTADCPFVQPELIDTAVEQVTEHDYIATDFDGRFPRGFDLEVVRRSTLQSALDEAVDPVEREHVTPFIVRRPDRFRHVALECPTWARHPQIRLTIDEAADLAALRAIVSGLGATPESLTGPALIQFCLDQPDVVALNDAVQHRIVK